MRKYKMTMNMFFAGVLTYMMACGNPERQAIENPRIDSILTIETNSTDSLKKNSFDFFEADKQMLAMDKQTSNLSPTKGFILYNGLNDTLKLELYYYQQKPIKLIYTTFDDGGKAAGLGSFYFDNSGYVFSNKIFYENFDIVELFLGEHKVLKYRKQSGGTEILKMNTEAQMYRESCGVKILDDYMMVLNEYNYIAPKPSEKSMPILQTLKPINLYSQPDTATKIIQKLPANDPLKYLENNRKRSVVSNRTWSWYHVVSKGGLDGWVFGHPEFVGDYNDETATK